MKAILILADGFEDSEAIITQDVLKRAGITVTLAGLNSKIIESSRGVRVIADTSFSVETAKKYDALILPGGGRGYKNLTNSASVNETIKYFDKNKKLIAAICAAPLVLANAGILENVKATVYPGLEKKIPKPRNEDVIVDGHIITSKGPGTAFLFALKIVEYLLGKKIANEVKREMVIE